MKLLKRSLPALLVMLTAYLSGCNNNTTSTDATTTATDTTKQVVQAPSTPQDDTAWTQKDGLYSVIYTPKGKIVCELEYGKAPMTVANFVSLSEGTNASCLVKKGKPFYDGLNFHRVEPGFVIQGGDPNGNGSGNPGYQFPNEIDGTLKHSKIGTLAMANAGPNTNGCQIYITLIPTPQLDGGYSVFGYVVSGFSTLTAITKGDKMDSIRIVRNGADAKAFDAAKTFATQMDAARKKVADTEMESKGAWDAKVKAKYPTARKTPSGLYYVIDKMGNGPMAKTGQTVVAHYTGTLFDTGKKFDSSVDRGQPFQFVIGQHQVIAGWDEGFGLLKVGTKGKLIIPSQLAYGDRGAGTDIPPHADLVFDVEMIAVK